MSFSRVCEPAHLPKNRSPGQTAASHPRRSCRKRARCWFIQPVLSSRSHPCPIFHPVSILPSARLWTPQPYPFFSVVGSPRFGRVTRPGQFPTRPVHCFPFVWWWHTTTPRPFGTTPRQQGLNPKRWVQDTSKMESTYDKWFQMADQVRARTLRAGT